MSRSFQTATELVPSISEALKEDAATLRLVGRQVHLHLDPDLTKSLQSKFDGVADALLEVTTAVQCEVDRSDEAAQFLLSRPGPSSEERMRAWHELRGHVASSLVSAQLLREGIYRRSIERDGFRDVRWTLGKRRLRDDDGETFEHPFALVSLHRHGAHRSTPYPWNQFLGDAVHPEPHVLEMDERDVERLLAAMKELQTTLTASDERSNTE